jgi:hypothetical protein
VAGLDEEPVNERQAGVREFHGAARPAPGPAVVRLVGSGADDDAGKFECVEDGVDVKADAPAHLLVAEGREHERVEDRLGDHLGDVVEGHRPLGGVGGGQHREHEPVEQRVDIGPLQPGVGMTLRAEDTGREESPHRLLEPPDGIGVDPGRCLGGDDFAVDQPKYAGLLRPNEDMAQAGKLRRAAGPERPIADLLAPRRARPPEARGEPAGGLPRAGR